MTIEEQNRERNAQLKRIADSLENLTGLTAVLAQRGASANDKKLVTEILEKMRAERGGADGV